MQKLRAHARRQPRRLTGSALGQCGKRMEGMSRVESARRNVVSLVMSSEFAPDAVGDLAASRFEL